MHLGVLVQLGLPPVGDRRHRAGSVDQGDRGRQPGSQCRRRVPVDRRHALRALAGDPCPRQAAGCERPRHRPEQVPQRRARVQPARHLRERHTPRPRALLERPAHAHAQQARALARAPGRRRPASRPCRPSSSSTRPACSGPAQLGTPNPRTRVIGTAQSPITSARSSSPLMAEPPIPAITTAVGMARSPTGLAADAVALEQLLGPSPRSPPACPRRLPHGPPVPAHDLVAEDRAGLRRRHLAGRRCAGRSRHSRSWPRHRSPILSRRRRPRSPPSDRPDRPPASTPCSPPGSYPACRCPATAPLR